MKIKIDSKAEALIFDIDGTLADTMKIHYQAWLNYGKKINFIYPEDMFYEMAGMPTNTIVSEINNRFGLSLQPDETAAGKENEFFKLAHKITPHDLVVDIVKEYFGKLPMSCGTGGRRKQADITLESLNLKKYFDYVITADDVQCHKPHPETFLKCAELMNVDPAKCVVFEDGDKGIEAAKAGGMMYVDVRDYLL